MPSVCSKMSGDSSDELIVAVLLGAHRSSSGVLDLEQDVYHFEQFWVCQ